MKKILFGILVGTTLVSSAFATNTAPPMPPHMDPVCKTAFDHINANRDKLDAAIKANDANTVGKIVIADHKYMDSFIASHPECNPPHPPKMSK